jgi:hypothetical protein
VGEWDNEKTLVVDGEMWDSDSVYCAAVDVFNAYYS